MPDFEQSREIDSAPDAVWRIVSDPDRLADWVPTTTASRPEGDDAVHLQGESHGHGYDIRSGFVADAAARRLSWDSPRLSGYQGTLHVAGQQRRPRTRCGGRSRGHGTHPGGGPRPRPPGG